MSKETFDKMVLFTIGLGVGIILGILAMNSPTNIAKRQPDDLNGYMPQSNYIHSEIIVGP